MKYNIIGSSSDGNAILVEDVLLLDCGVSYKKLKKYLKDVKLIFISHNHQDHLNKTAVKQIAYNFPKIKFVTGSTEVVFDLQLFGVAPQNIYILPCYKKYDLGLVKVKLEKLYHDVSNCALKWELKGKKGIYIVDTANVDDIEAKDYDLYLIENNYREDILKKHIDECEDENMRYYLNRVPHTHLSDEQCNSFLIENMGKNSVYEYIHQSKYNFENREE